ncbi:hypothetical protein EC968_005539 [Mortierella alpina]|nr:hypothetical protein EC968_005539 [Mortierella alpina]
MANNTARTVRLAAMVFSAILTLLLLRSLFHHPSNNRRSSRLRVEEPVVVILVHPSPSLNKAANFELKRAIARTWAKDVEDFGASVFFVGEHDGETVMRRPSEFQGRAQSLSTRFGPISLGTGSSGADAGAGADGSTEPGYSKEEPMRKMLIPSVLENGQADDASGLLKAYHFLYNNTNWYAGPIFQTYPFILTTDTTHYIHVENLVATLLSSRPRRLLTLKDDPAFSGSMSEASECSAEDFGDKAPLTSTNDDHGRPNPRDQHSHWTLARTHLISKQLIAMVGPHLHECVKLETTAAMDSGEAFQRCVKEWALSPLFWKNGYCGRLAALRYQAPAPGSPLDSSIPQAMSSRAQYGSRKERMGSPPTPDEFEEFYRLKQQERALEVQRQQQNQGSEASDETVEEESLLMQKGSSTREKAEARKLLQQLTSSGGGPSESGPAAAHWIVGSGLTQPEDFTLIYQSLVDREELEDEYQEDLDY